MAPLVAWVCCFNVNELGAAMTFKSRLLISIGLLLIVSFVVIELINYQRTLESGVENLKQQAEELRGVLMSMRRVYHLQFLESGIELTEDTVGFLPAHAMNRISSGYSEWSGSGMSFNNVSDNPRNVDQYADSVEQQAIAHFQENPDEELVFRPFTSERGEPYYLYARPIWVERYCLQCHGSRDAAPKTIRKLYTTAYDYQEGDLRGVLSIKLPASDLQRQAGEQFARSMMVHLLWLLALYAIIVYLVHHYVSIPLKQIMEGMEKVRQNDYRDRLPVMRGEFHEPSIMFNRMIEQIVSSNQARDHFLASMSHDLRTPLSAIIGNAELMREECRACAFSS